MGKYFVDITDEAKKHLALIRKSGDKNFKIRLTKFLKLRKSLISKNE